MDIYQFMNSKTLFKFVRNRPLDQQPAMPVMVHISELVRKGAARRRAPAAGATESRRGAPHVVEAGSCV